MPMEMIGLVGVSKPNKIKNPLYKRGFFYLKIYQPKNIGIALSK
jgi:hypothetical protein